MPMNGRFPIDVFLIVFLPILGIPIYAFLGTLLIPQHVHHRLAVLAAMGLTALGVSGAVVLWVRHTKRKVTPNQLPTLRR